MTPAPRAGIYVRISSDREGAGLGVKRQETDARELAKTLGATVARVYADNDISASGKKRRPEYIALLDAIRAGAIDIVIAWHTDRLHRSPVELEEYIAACDTRQVPTYTVKAGHLDLTSPSGRMVARLLGATARYEIEHMAERRRRAKAQAAADGAWRGGRRPYGYAADGVTLVPEEAAVIEAASKEILAGASLRSIARRLNDSGEATSTGRPWRPDSLRDVLMRGRNAGLIEHGGEIVGQASWQAIVPEDIWRGVKAVLADPSRRTQLSAARKHLGSGLYRCFCGLPVRGHINKRVPHSYACTGPTLHMTKASKNVDDHVVKAVIARLSREDARELLVAPEADNSALAAEAEALRQRLDEAARLFADGVITGAQLATMTTTLRGKLEGVEAELAQTTSASALGVIVGHADVRQRWEELDIDQRRLIIDTLMTVTLLRGKRGRPKNWKPGEGYMDLDSVQITWK